MTLTASMILALSVVSQAQVKVPDEIEKLLQKNTCYACHRADQKLVGPSYKEVMAKKKYKPEQIVELIYNPKPANWPGYPPMAALPNVPKEEAMKIAEWMVTLAPKAKK